MRQLIFLFLISLPVITFAQKEWFPVDASAGQIEISFYEQPYEKMDTITLAPGLVATMINWEKEIEDPSHPNALYSIVVTDLPAAVMHSDSAYEMIEPLFESSASAIVAGGGIEYLSSKIQMKDGYPGKNYKFKMQETGGMLELQMFMVKNQLIQLSIVTRPENWFNKQIDQFTNSFKLLGRGQNNIDYGFTYIDKASFKINFPGKTKIESMFTDTDIGKLNLRIEMFEGDMKNGETFYMAGETKYPESFKLTDENREAQYTKSIKGALGNTNATLVERKTLNRDGYEYVEVYASMYEGEVHAVYQFFWIGNAGYMLGAMSPEKGKTKKMEAFFESFKLLK